MTLDFMYFETFKSCTEILVSDVASFRGEGGWGGGGGWYWCLVFRKMTRRLCRIIANYLLKRNISMEQKKKGSICITLHISFLGIKTVQERSHVTENNRTMQYLWSNILVLSHSSEWVNC